MMRIGLDGLPLAQRKTGVGHYTFELARHLALLSRDDEFELIAPRGDVSMPHEDYLAANLRNVRIDVNALTRHWWTIGLPRYLGRNPPALFHGTNYDVPLRGRLPTVLTIHDLSALLHPQTHPARQVRRARRRLPLMARHATKIITPTDAVRREVSELLSVPTRKVTVVPEAARACFRPLPLARTLDLRRRLSVEDDFLLFVGTIEPRKNLITLVKALEDMLRATTLRPQLVIAGQTGWLADEFFAYVRRSPVVSRIHFTGYLSDDELCALYSSCRAFIYPSLYEGFGLPPLEAMACGAPVIVGDIPAVAEVVGPAARFFAVAESDSLARAVVELCTDDRVRQVLVEAGFRRAAEFTWARTAQMTYDVYQDLLGSTTTAAAAV